MEHGVSKTQPADRRPKIFLRKNDECWAELDDYNLLTSSRNVHSLCKKCKSWQDLTTRPGCSQNVKAVTSVDKLGESGCIGYY